MRLEQLQCFFSNLKLWDVKSANLWKTINVKQFFLNSEEPQEDMEVIVKCCSWSADGARIMVAAKNKIFVSISKNQSSSNLKKVRTFTKFCILQCLLI